ncbi:MAG: alpha-N-acetylglucosaminidase [Prevotellaceae bacterium]|nr:alpha-N-acetylglucosaminidase [Prevotellaceae bacterium]
MKKIKLMIAMLAVSAVMSAVTKDEQALYDLVGRIAPQHQSNFVFKQKKQKGETYTVEAKGGKAYITGSNAQAMAVGLNYYFKYHCNTTVSWLISSPVEMPQQLPAAKKHTQSARFPTRFFLNYCTFGYTMPWFTWADWERFIDWMALNGINMPLANTGAEEIAYRVYTSLGMSDEDTRASFTGPAHLPWHRMSNIDKWQGPLPQSWLKGQLELQKKIVARERELGMKPVLPGFSGHVPGALREKFPNAKITKLHNWAGFRDETSCYFLDPQDSLFAEIQHRYIREVIKEFGTDHIYGIDPFNEMKLPSEDPAYLADVAKGIYGTLTDVDPEATWLQMAWMFYFDKGTWTPERVKAFLTAVPQDKMILLDYWGEYQEIWRLHEKFHGQPYIWCYLGNFGGNTHYNAEFEKVRTRVETTYKEGGSNFSGLGCTLEGFDINPEMHEYFFEKAWTNYPTDEQFLTALADRHVGTVDTTFRTAWNDLYYKIINGKEYSGTPNTATEYPRLNKDNQPYKTSAKLANDNVLAFNVWQQLLSAKKTDNALFVYDAVNQGREVLGTYFYCVRNDFSQACYARDIATAEQKAKEMLQTLDDLDLLLGLHKDFSFNKWVDDARSWGQTPEEKEYFEVNARTLVTTWGFKGHSLRDYARRTWHGLVAHFYKRRWEIYINHSLNAARRGVDVDADNMRDDIFQFEWNFTQKLADAELTEAPVNGSPVSVMRKMAVKYSPLIQAQADKNATNAGQEKKVMVTPHDFY